MQCKYKRSCQEYLCINARSCLFNDLKDEKIYRNHPKKVKALMKLGHKAECVCCHEDDNLTFDHVIPTSKGGSNDNSNG